MRWLAPIVLFLSAVATPAVAATATAATTAEERTPVAAIPAVAAPGAFTVLSYHEVQRDIRDFPDPFAVDGTALVRQLAWLRGNGYTAVSLDDITAARDGGKPLPAKAVLLSFDDAYISFYTRVYPLLREFRFPAVLGVVGRWIDDERRVAVRTGRTGAVADTSYATWSQIREMAASGLVEIASHTYDLHRGVPANPQGNLEPAATARIHDPVNGGYEDDASWRARVRADLARNSNVIERETGRRPRAVVWPYGSYNDELVRMAGELGMSIAFTLNDGANTTSVPLTALRRTLIEHNPSLAEFSTEERGPLYPEPVRVVQADLDDIYNPDPAQQERNLSALLDRVEVLKPTHVFLQATTDTDGDGFADAAYFPNRHLPLRSDLFNRAAWQLATRNDVKVFAVLPVTGFRIPHGAVADIYEDLARYANFDGLVFDDKVRPGEVEGAGTLELTRQLALRVRPFRAPLKTVLATRSTQGLAEFVAEYDYVALTVHPGFPIEDPAIRRKVVFMQQTDPAPGNGKPMAGRMRALQLGGNLNFGYGPDDSLHDNPPLAAIAPVMSLRVYPQADVEKEK